ncbi:MAG TPA: hypothetical protein VIA18_07755, partial [Polyangia bacterium]|nr:hypothetical protein [Polyangia bacterium]
LRNLAFRAVVIAGGVRPIAFGIANIALYAAAALLVLALFTRVTNDARAAAWATALWIVLPVHVEAVAYASALGDLLSLALELPALVVALPFVATNGRRWRVVASTALAAAAMLAKEMAVTEPALVVLVAVALGGDVWRRRRLVAVAVAHGVAALAYVALRTHVVGAVGQEPLTAQSLATGLRDAPWLLVHYAWISVAPLGHAASYRVPPPSTLALVTTLVSLVATAVATWRWRRAVLVGLAWFAVALAPVLHLVPLWADLADRFALFPSVGLALALAAAMAGSRRRLWPVLVALTIIYALASLVEERAWRSDATLWRYAVDREPDAPLARGNLAAVLLGEGRVEEALAQLEALHALGYTRGDVELKRAYVLSRMGRADEAARAIAASLRLDGKNGAAHALAGQLALAAGDAGRAARELEAAHTLAPAHPSTGLLGYQLLRARAIARAPSENAPAGDARVDYLTALQALTFDDAAGAVQSARACLSRSPGRPQCEAVLGQALVLQGPLDGEARVLLDRCIAGDGPDRARCQEAEWGAR